MPNKQSPVWHVPHSRNPFFTGRSHVLNDLRRELTSRGKAALSGMGGIGKTQTAVEYAYRHRGEHGAVLWAKADSEDTLKTDFAGIAAKLELSEKEGSDRDKIVAAVSRWLDTNAGWLLILDNADDLSLVSDVLRHEWGGHVLLTTRAHATGGISSVEIKVMEPEEGALFLLRRAKLVAIDEPLGVAEESDQGLAEEITRQVGGLPLALDQAGAFIEEVRSSLGEYLSLYRTEGAQLRAARGGVISDHDPVTITFSLAFRQVEGVSAAAADMLRACAFLAPDSIPEEIFSDGAAMLGEHLALMAGGGISLVKAISEAGRFSLIRRNTKSGTIEVHRLVQQVLKDEMDTETRRLWAARVIQGIYAALPEVEHGNWPLLEKLLPHAQEGSRLIDEYGFKFREAAQMLSDVGAYCNDRAQYAEAESLLVRALSIYEEVLGPDHPDVAVCLNNLASTYNRQGRYAEAEPIYVRALNISEKALDPNHRDIAARLNNLATLYSRQNRDTEAEPLLIRALSIYEEALGPDHSEVALCRNNLAYVYVQQGRDAEAEPLLVQALSIREKAFGPDHPDVALCLNNLAYIYWNRAQHAEAESLLVRALSIREKALGPDHPDVAVGLNNVAYIYSKQSRYAEAEPLQARALSILMKTLGPEHPSTSSAQENYAALLERMREQAKG
jgi:tetratricopeptide (TPR) repeat protein